MGLRRGLSAVHEMKEQQGSGQDYANRVVIMPGETALLRLYGDFETDQDPIIGTVHYVKRLPKGQQYNNCSKNNGDDNARCVFCYVRESEGNRKKDDGVGAQNRAYFHAEDYRKIHKLDQEVRILKPGVVWKAGVMNKPDDYKMTKYPPCLAPKRVCSFCQQGNVAKVGGYRYWELSVTYADQLVSQQNELRTFCKCGARTENGEGTICVNQYLCSGCNSPVEFYPEQGKPVVYCSHCRQTLQPLEEISCSNPDCSGAQRCSLQDFFFRVTRNGEGTDTTYNFEPVHPCKPPSEEKLAEAAEHRPDFEKILSAEPPEMQAALLNIPVPPGFESIGHGAQQYNQAGAQSGRISSSKPNLSAGSPKPGFKPPAFKVPGAKPGFKLPGRPPVQAAQADDEVPYE